MFISKQGAKKIEKSEVAGTITLRTLNKVGKAMNMKFVYGFIPIDGSIELLIERKSRALTEKIILRTNHNMMLENQGIGKNSLEKAIDDLINEIKSQIKRKIWD